MIKYIVYIAAALLIIWSVVYLIRSIQRQLRGQGGCDGACGSCTQHCRRRKSDK